jgi:hypothetical protein
MFKIRLFYNNILVYLYLSIKKFQWQFYYYLEVSKASDYASELALDWVSIRPYSNCIQSLKSRMIKLLFQLFHKIHLTCIHCQYFTVQNLRKQAHLWTKLDLNLCTWYMFMYICDKSARWISWKIGTIPCMPTIMKIENPLMYYYLLHNLFCLPNTYSYNFC